MTQALASAGIVLLERGWLSSNNVVLHGDEHRAAVVVDTGYWTHAEQTVALLRATLRGAPLSRIVNTHLHSDHCGGNAAVQAAFGCSADIPAGERDAVDAWDATRLSYDATGQHCPRFVRGGLLAAGEVVAAGRWDWQVLGAPGHDPMAVALYQPEHQVLISADALWHDGFGVVFPELAGDTGFDDVRATLQCFERLPVRWVLPGHGAAFSDVRAALDRALRRVDSLEADPRRHALHAAKVLIKFRLLETRAERWSAFERWVENVPYLDLVHRRYFGDRIRAAWIRGLIEDLCDRGALAATVDGIENR